MTKTIKELFNLVGSPFVFDTTVEYPEIEGDTSNFLTDYAAHKEDYDRYFVHEYGERLLDLDADNDADAEEEYLDQMKSILMIYLFSWARLYYTLNIPFNPVYNVEEHITNTYGQHVTDTDFGASSETNQYGARTKTDTLGARSETNQYGATEHTEGARSDTSTMYAVSYDSSLEKETSKQADSTGSQTSTDAQHTDTHSTQSVIDTHGEAAVTDTHSALAKKDTTTSKQHVDTVDREGNIGVVSATQLVIEEERFRRNYSFFKNCFLTMIEELGAYYADPIL